MLRKAAVMAVCAAFLLFTGFALAQSQNVQITNGPTVENATGNSATIAWSTNVSSGSVLKYGTDANNLNQTAQVPWGGITHRITLKNLQPNQTYYFQVQSGQGQGTGTGAVSNIAQFQTTSSGASNASAQQPQPGAQPSASNAQVVVGPIMQKVTDTSAQVYWETTQPTENIVKYGTSPSSLTQTAQVPFGGQTHEVSLPNLQPNTPYYISIQDPSGQVRATSSFRTFPPGGLSQQAVQITNGPNIEYLTPTQAIVSWSTSAPSSSIVKYGQDPNALNQTAQAQWGGTTHRVTLNNLQPNSQYWFQVQSGQAQGTGSMAQTSAFPFRTIQQGQSAMTFSQQPQQQ